MLVNLEGPPLKSFGFFACSLKTFFVSIKVRVKAIKNV